MPDKPSVKLAPCPCGKPRGRTIPKGASKAARARHLELLAGDPYCSAGCCRKAHGAELVATHLEAAQTKRAETEDEGWDE